MFNSLILHEMSQISTQKSYLTVITYNCVDLEENSTVFVDFKKKFNLYMVMYWPYGGYIFTSNFYF